jgi:hypothetical protein
VKRARRAAAQEPPEKLDAATLQELAQTIGVASRVLECYLKAEASPPQALGLAKRWLPADLHEKISSQTEALSRPGAGRRPKPPADIFESECANRVMVEYYADQLARRGESPAVAIAVIAIKLHKSHKWVERYYYPRERKKWIEALFRELGIFSLDPDYLLSISELLEIDENHLKESQGK